MMTAAVRNAPQAVSRTDGPCTRVGDLSEAHALAGLVTAVANAILCLDIPRVTGFVETDLGHVLAPARLLFLPFFLFLYRYHHWADRCLPSITKTTSILLFWFDCPRLRVVFLLTLLWKYLLSFNSHSYVSFSTWLAQYYNIVTGEPISFTFIVNLHCYWWNNITYISWCNFEGSL